MMVARSDGISVNAAQAIDLRALHSLAPTEVAWPLSQAQRASREWAESASALATYPTIESLSGFDLRYISRAALISLIPGGVVIVDYAEQHLNAADSLRHSALIEACFTGLPPAKTFTSTSSAFVHRKFDSPHVIEAGLWPVGGVVSQCVAPEDIPRSGK